MAAVTDQELDRLLHKIMPVLEGAVRGDYSGKIQMEEGDRLNEVYAGIQVLLDTINEQVGALEEANTQLYDYLSRRHGLQANNDKKDRV
jgi:hypothetical protein